MNYTKALNNKIFEIISKASQELNLESYVIGGFVRDHLLQRDFKKDIDIVAIGSGIELALKVSDKVEHLEILELVAGVAAVAVCKIAGMDSK